jgi:hypothetical protein
MSLNSVTNDDKSYILQVHVSEGVLLLEDMCICYFDSYFKITFLVTILIYIPPRSVEGLLPFNLIKLNFTKKISKILGYLLI